MFFKKEWHGFDLKLNILGKDYFITTYPLDIEECDTVVIRVYEDEQHADEYECGNGVWLDSDFGCVEGNNELYFEDDINNTVESTILEEVHTLLVKEGVL